LGEDIRYRTLVNVLDRICGEAPPERRTYHPDPANDEAVHLARSRAYIHLYLKVNYGLLHFEEREKLVTDGPSDGGVDAYFIDRDRQVVDFVQSKLRATADNFRDKEAAYDELLAMEVDRIAKGESTSSAGNPYNAKIRALQKALEDIPDIGRYKYRVVILANLGPRKLNAVKKFVSGFPVELYDHERAFTELVFPVVSGTYFNAPTLTISLDLSNTMAGSARVSYSVLQDPADCDVSLLFVPAIEIGRILHDYKNSILRFNPRSYLGLSGNAVNNDIRDSIICRKTNVFALFNNGITMLSDETNFNERVGVKDRAQVVVTNPQILNGGQTAFTLSRIYEDVLSGAHPRSVFDGKEVLLRIITFNSPYERSEAKLHLVEDISRATNSQTPVTEADRRANDDIQVAIQSEIFERYGYYYERKLGEFDDGIREGYVGLESLIDREEFLRVSMACDLRLSQARGMNAVSLFREDNFGATLHDTSRIDEFFLAYMCLRRLNALERANRRRRDDLEAATSFGQALRYGKFAVVGVCANRGSHTDPFDVDALVDTVLGEWASFELAVRDKPDNRSYFPLTESEQPGLIRQVLNYDGYYKGKTVNRDVREYFALSPAAAGVAVSAR
jgi:hypothetical protein